MHCSLVDLNLFVAQNTRLLGSSSQWNVVLEIHEVLLCYQLPMLCDEARIPLLQILDVLFDAIILAVLSKYVLQHAELSLVCDDDSPMILIQTCTL